MTTDPDHKKEKRITPMQAKKRAESFCAYQERAQQEVRDKLYNWGLYQTDVENIISELITENFLSEERFAHAYVSGKFKIKQWGKVKIENGLRLKRIPPRLTQEALATIDFDEYMDTLQQVIKKKSRLLKESHPYKRKMKLAQYAASRGFESSLIFEILNNEDES